MPLTANAAALKSLIESPGIHPMPGCADAVGARLIADAGYRLGFISGSTVAALRLARPDIDVLSFTEMADAVDVCSTAAPEVLWMADGDTGYGNEINVQRSILACAKAGASAILIEDKAYPRPLGHGGRKIVVDRRTARRRFRAAAEACQSAGIVLLARTDALHAHGREEALARIADFAEDGADMLYFDSPATEADLVDSIKAAGGKPAIAVSFPGAKYFAPPDDELERLGVKLVIHPSVMFAAATYAMREALLALKGGVMPPLGTDEERAEVIRRPQFLVDDTRWSEL